MDKDPSTYIPNPAPNLVDSGIVVTPFDSEQTKQTEVDIATRLALARDEVDALYAIRVNEQRQKERMIQEFKELVWEIKDAESAYTFPSLAGDPIAFARHKGLRATAAELIDTIREQSSKITALDVEIEQLDAQILSLEAIKY